MSVTDEYLTNNEACAAEFSGPLPLPPAKHVAVLACMDARLNVYGALGIKEGESHVIRNAGGVVTDDEIRSLAISQHLLGTEEIILIHHTDCGMLTFTDEEFAEELQGDRPAASLGRRVVHLARGRRPQVVAADHRQPLRPQEGLHPRVHLRCGHRPAQRGQPRRLTRASSASGAYLRLLADVLGASTARLDAPVRGR